MTDSDIDREADIRTRLVTTDNAWRKSEDHLRSPTQRFKNLRTALFGPGGIGAFLRWKGNFGAGKVKSVTGKPLIAAAWCEDRGPVYVCAIENGEPRAVRVEREDILPLMEQADVIGDGSARGRALLEEAFAQGTPVPLTPEALFADAPPAPPDPASLRNPSRTTSHEPHASSHESHETTLDREQRYFDTALEHRERRRLALQGRDWRGVAADRAAQSAYIQETTKELEALPPPHSAVAFGRFDTEDETVYLGEMTIFDDDSDVLVVNWKNPAAEPYYQASEEDHMGVLLKREFETRLNEILSFQDRRFGPEPAERPGGPTEPVLTDTLLAELEAGRTGEMHQIVRTIQAAQDKAMRFPLESLLVIQGGPGTGKTIIGLHRAAVLLYLHEELRERGILVVGPNRAFMRYVQNVLPSLGETNVVQVAVEQLSPGDLRVRGSDSAAAARVKGDSVMIDVMTRAVADRVRPPTEERIDIRVDSRRISVPGSDLREVVDSTRQRGLPHNAARDAFRDRVLRHILDRNSWLSPEDVTTSQDLSNLVDRVWPRLTAQAVLRDLLGNRDRLSLACEGLLSDEQKAALYRPSQDRLADEPWAVADMPLLDELDTLLNGPSGQYSHIIVDEAQDLSPMQLFSVARRSENGSITLLGDLAQATGSWAHRNWEEVCDLLPDEYDTQTLDLPYGYRVPRQILDWASRLLPEAAPGVDPPTPVRDGPTEPQVLHVAPDLVQEQVIQAARRYASEGNSVGIIASAGVFEGLLEAFREAGLTFEDGRERMGSGFTLVPALQCKGLEFDSVVVVEPSTIVQEDPAGQRLLYVALTRPTRHLTVVYSGRLPAALSDEPVPVPSTPSTEERKPAPPVAVGPTEAAAEPTVIIEIPTDPGSAAHTLVHQLVAEFERETRRHLGPRLWEMMIAELETRLIGEQQSGGGRDDSGLDDPRQTDTTEVIASNKLMPAEDGESKQDSASSPGWYPDPYMQARLRYWDGQIWTDHLR